MPRLLVVDDDSDTRELFAVALSFLGFDVTTAGDAVAALAIQAEHDAMVVDLAMPEMSGIELIQRIRARESPPVPIVVVTGQGNSGILREAANVSCAVLTKPCDVSELVARLETLIRTCAHDCDACANRQAN